MAASRELADFLASTSYADLPPQVVVDAHRSILDWLGSAMAGALEPPARKAQRAARRFGESNEATMFAGGRASAAGAALANGVASHILELDDIHKGSTVHAAAPVIPAALAVAEREHASGRDFVLAVALGYEAALRVGEAVNPSHYRFWHPTGTAATFGATAAAASLLRLDARQTLDALGSAGTQAAGLWEFNADGSMSKHLHPGKAALNGVLSADLAGDGFTGASTILEGNRGFFRAMSASYDETRVTAGLGTQWKISENCYKVWACCGHTHSAIDIARTLRERAVDVDAVTSVEIETYGPGYEIVKEPSPRTPYEAKFSIAYCVAAALVHGGAPLDAFSIDHFGDGVVHPRIAALLRRITVKVAPDLTAKYPAAWPARVRLTLATGEVLDGASDYPVGNPENPVSTQQLEEKFTGLVAPGPWGRDASHRALDAVRAIDRCDDMVTLFASFAANPITTR